MVRRAHSPPHKRPRFVGPAEDRQRRSQRAAVRPAACHPAQGAEHPVVQEARHRDNVVGVNPVRQREMDRPCAVAVVHLRKLRLVRPCAPHRPGCNDDPRIRARHRLPARRNKALRLHLQHDLGRKAAGRKRELIDSGNPPLRKRMIVTGLNRRVVRRAPRAAGHATALVVRDRQNPAFGQNFDCRVKRGRKRSKPPVSHQRARVKQHQLAAATVIKPSIVSRTTEKCVWPAGT